MKAGRLSSNVDVVFGIHKAVGTAAGMEMIHRARREIRESGNTAKRINIRLALTHSTTSIPSPSNNWR